MDYTIVTFTYSEYNESWYRLTKWNDVTVFDDYHEAMEFFLEKMDTCINIVGFEIKDGDGVLIAWRDKTIDWEGWPPLPKF